MEYIDTNNLKPGDLLPSEATLARDFGVSRPVVREAPQVAGRSGVVEIVNGKGAVIKPMDDTYLRLFFQRAIQIERATLVELMEVRKPLEVQSATLAAQRRSPEEAAQLKATVAAMRDCLHDMEAYPSWMCSFTCSGGCCPQYHHALSDQFNSGFTEECDAGRAASNSNAEAVGGYTGRP